MLKTIKEAAELTGVSEGRLRRAVSAEQVPSLALGSRKLVDVETVRKVFAEREEGIGIQEVSDATGLTVSAIRRGIREGWVPCRKDGKAYTFDLAAVVQAIQDRLSGGSR